MARELYGPELYRSRTLELNASDDRGIKVVREKVKNFAQGAVGHQKNRYSFLKLPSISSS
jgi:replication factor C subunit 2/4